MSGWTLREPQPPRLRLPEPTGTGCWPWGHRSDQPQLHRDTWSLLLRIIKSDSLTFDSQAVLGAGDTALSKERRPLPWGQCDSFVRDRAETGLGPREDPRENTQSPGACELD